jgi:hypothetical protein
MGSSSSQGSSRQTKRTVEVEALMVRLVDITAVHGAILELESALSMPPLNLPPEEVRAVKILRSVLIVHPIPVIRAKEKFLCVGNARLFRLAKSCLATNDEIPALVLKSRCTREALQINYLVELYALPAVLALELDDVRRLHDVWKNNPDNPHLSTAFPLTTKSAFANAFRVSPRSLSTHATPKPKQQ